MQDILGLMSYWANELALKIFSFFVSRIFHRAFFQQFQMFVRINDRSNYTESTSIVAALPIRINQWLALVFGQGICW